MLEISLSLWITESLVITVLEHCCFPNKGLNPQLVLADSLPTVEFFTGGWNAKPHVYCRSLNTIN